MLLVSNGVNVDFNFQIKGMVSFFDTFSYGIDGKSKNDAIDNLTKQAEKLGADAIIGINFSLSSAVSENDNEIYTGVIAVGTAVKLS